MNVIESSILTPGQKTLDSIIALNSVAGDKENKGVSKEELEKNIISINIYNRLTNRFCVGSGFFLTADGFIATAGHITDVLYTFVPKPYAPIEITQDFYFAFDSTGREYPLDTTFVYRDSGLDVALLKAIKPEPAKPIGYRFNENFPANQTLSLIAPSHIKPEGFDIEKIDGKLIRKGLPLHWINEAGLDKIWVDAIGRPGQSGSPIINEYAEICATFCGVGPSLLPEASYSAPADSLVKLINSSVACLAERYRKITGYDPLSGRHIPAHLHDKHRQEYLSMVKRCQDLKNK